MIIVFWFIILPLMLTILIEALVARAFLSSRNDLKIVALAQCVTNPIVNLIIVLCRYLQVPAITVLIVGLEVMAVIAEALIYQKCFSEGNKNKSVCLSLVANMAAFATGYIVLVLLLQHI